MGALLFCFVFLYNKEKELIKLEITRHKDIAVYTVDNYNDFVEANSGLSYEELLGRAESVSFGCAFVFFYHLEHLRGEYNARYNQMQEGYYRKYVLRDFVNQVANELKERLAQILHDYIVSKNGLVDSWPHPRYLQYFHTGIESIDDLDRIYFDFDYFGNDIEEGKRYSTSILYQNHYCLPKNREYADYLGRLSKAGERYRQEKEKQRSGILDVIKAVIVHIPMVLGLIAGVLMLIWTYTNKGEIADIKVMQTLITMFKSDNLFFKVLSFIPMVVVGISAIMWYLASVIGWIFKAEKLLMPFMAMVVAGIFYGLTELLGNVLHYDIGGSTAFKEAKKTIKKITKDARYIKLKKEYEAENAVQSAIAEKWHQLWYADWVK